MLPVRARILKRSSSSISSLPHLYQDGQRPAAHWFIIHGCAPRQWRTPFLPARIRSTISMTARCRSGDCAAAAASL